MAMPLFTTAELKTHEARKREIEERRRTQTDWNASWGQVKALEASHEVELVRRAQARPVDFLNGLVVLVGSRATKYISFDDAFEKADDAAQVALIKQYNTLEARRNLYTILRALTEVPKSWAMSAFLRFLRGSGKQKDATQHGAGMFGPLFGWKEKEVKARKRWLVAPITPIPIPRY